MKCMLAQYPSITEDFLKKIKPSPGGATIIALHGNLGAGKTTLSQEIARQLGVEESVTSPTFIIQKEYEIKPAQHSFVALNHINQLIHIDTYRLNSADELIALGFMSELSNPKNLIIVEWPEKVENILPQDTTHIYIDYLDKDQRSITIKLYGENAENTKEG